MPTPTPAGLLVLSAADVERLFGIDLAIASQRTAFKALGLGLAILPPRLLVPGRDDSVAFCYAARLSADSGAVSKFGSVNPANAERGLPSVSAVVTVLDAADGHPVAVMDGTSVTTLRTAAASALAAEVLARHGSRSLAILGSGVQAGAHVQAIGRVLSLDDVRIWSPHPGRRQALVELLAAGHPVRAADSAAAAVRGADVVVCCTSSKEPVVEVDWLAPGATVISIGSFAADRREVPASVVAGAQSVVVDDVTTALQDAGPIVTAVADSMLSVADLIPFGEVVAGLRPGRRDDSGLVYYNSVGVGVQDAAAALAIVAAARTEGGTAPVVI